MRLKYMGFKVPEELRNQLKAIAALNGVTLNRAAVDAIQLYVSHSNNEKGGQNEQNEKVQTNA